MSDCPLPFLELVERLREAGFDLTPQQYAQFRQALIQGFGSRNLDEMRQLCRLLWVKPSSSYDAKTFERVFDQFVDAFTPPSADLSPQKSSPVTSSKSSPAALPDVQPPQIKNQYPTAPPPRLFPDDNQTSAQGENKSGGQVPIAIAAPPIDRTPVVGSDYHLTSMDKPLSELDWQALWSVLKYPTPMGREQRLDIAATIRRMERQGPDCDPVLRPVLSRQSIAIVFLDTNNAMIPFRPVIQPLLDAIAVGRITPAQVYSFKTVPLQFVYPWQRPVEATSVERVLSQLHRQRTIAIIVSDAGAASRIYNQDRVHKTREFLERLAPCVQQMIWLNPLPPSRWPYSSAIAISDFLQGRMYSLSHETTAHILADRHRRFLPTSRPLTSQPLKTVSVGAGGDL